MWTDLKRFAAASGARKMLLLEAFLALAAARLAMALLPFRMIAAWLGGAVAEGVMDAAGLAATALEMRMAAEVGSAVGRVARRLPWDARCLAQALAATAMLRRRRIAGTLRMGARTGPPAGRDEGAAGFEAHAWLSVGGQIVTGAMEAPSFRALASFQRGQLKRMSQEGLERQAG